MYEITITGWFAAAHQLRLPDGTLEPLHGHNWRVTATWRGERLDSMGVLVDFTKVKPRLDALLAEFHDRHLNENPAFQRQNPSAENVAALIAERLGDEPGAALWFVEVEEAPGCTARYFPHAEHDAGPAAH